MTVGDQIVREFYSLEMSVNDHEPVSPQNIAELVQLTTHPDQRALLLFDTAREYMKAARVDLTNESIITDWFERKQAVSSGRDPIDGSTAFLDRKSTRLNSSHVAISYAVFCLQKKTETKIE